MARVIGIGGVFFKAKDVDALRAWYVRVLGLPVNDWGGVFFKAPAVAATPGAGTVWSAFEEDTEYFAPSTKSFMVNLMVDDLDGVLARCREQGVEAKVMPDEANGRFAHVLDPEGNKIELWEPAAMP